MVIDQIIKYIDSKGISVYAFENKLGVSRGGIAKAIAKKTNIGSNVLENILIHYSDINAEWLLTGRGEMFKPDKNTGVNTGVNTGINTGISIKNEEIYPLKLDKELGTASAVSETLTSHRLNDETRPRIPYNAAAGSLSMSLTGVTNGDCELVPVVYSFSRYDFTVFVRGDSMEPEFHSGDELACLFIEAGAFVQWGRYHVLDTSQGILVKRIFDNIDSIICKSESDQHPDFDIPKDEVYSLALVIGLLRRF